MASFLKLPPAIRTSLRYGSFATFTALTLSFVESSLFRVQDVRGPSMSPTLSPHYHERGDCDHILVIKRYLPFLEAETSLARLERGDIVTFTKRHKPGEESVKRVVGLPGDTIMRDPRRIGRRGGKSEKELSVGTIGPVVVVPQGSVWVEGDNWRESLDSNDFGPISMALINGRASRILWPLNRFGPVGDERPVKEKRRTVVIEGDRDSVTQWEVYQL